MRKGYFDCLKLLLQIFVLKSIYHKIDFTTSNIVLTFKTGSTTVGTGNATLLDIGNGIGILTYRGDTGFNDAGNGDRPLLVEYDAGFGSIIGGSVTSGYRGNVSAYQTFCYIYKDYIDNYVHKSVGDTQMRYINFIIIGKFA